MSTKISVRKCEVCTKENPGEHWRKITEYSLEKAKCGTAYQQRCLQLKVNDTLCNSCYCVLVMYDTNKKYQRTTKRKKEHDATYSVKQSKKSRVLLNNNEYNQLLDKAKSAEELAARVHELEIELENIICTRSTGI